MNKRMIARILGKVLLIFAALMLLPLAAGLWYGERVTNFIIAIAATAAARALRRCCWTRRSGRRIST